MQMYDSFRPAVYDEIGLHDPFPDLKLTRVQRERAHRRRVRADFPRGTRVTGLVRSTGQAFVGRVTGYHEHRPDWSHLPAGGRVVRPTLIVGPIVACDDGTERHPGTEYLHKVPTLTRRQAWALVVAHHNGGVAREHAGISEDLLLPFYDEANHGFLAWRPTPAGAILARALADTAPPPRLGYRQLRALAALRAEGGIALWHAAILQEMGIATQVMPLAKLGLVDTPGERVVVLNALGERALDAAPRVSDLLLKALAEHSLTAQVADLGGDTEALVVTVADGQLIVTGRTSSQISYQTWAHDGLDAYLAPTEEGPWCQVYASRETNAESDVRAAAAAIAAHAQRAARS